MITTSYTYYTGLTGNLYHLIRVSKGRVVKLYIKPNDESTALDVDYKFNPDNYKQLKQTVDLSCYDLAYS